MTCYKKRRTIRAIFLMLLLTSGGLAYTQRTITVRGFDWSVTKNPVAITEAGNDYNSSVYESAANQVLLDVGVPFLLGGAKVSARYEANPTWNTNLQLSVRRTQGGGSWLTVCLGCVVGGLNYQQLSLVDAKLFEVSSLLSLTSFTDIPIQLKLEGVSVTVPANTYGARVVFTISAL